MLERTESKLKAADDPPESSHLSDLSEDPELKDAVENVDKDENG